ncbi:zinc-finger associated domain (zf-AD) domain-containing protein [Phthorimaea operculella]|nr:zinc-finger associated domain (zf-AD) domain-containing protein [Phthorimaea operculella]
MGMSTTECRVCLQDGGTVPIFGNDDDRPDISLEVRVFGGVPLSKDDEFPKGLCEACFRLLENAVSFRKSALLANIELQRRRVQQSSTKGLEADDEDTHTKPKVSTNTNKIKDDTSDGISLSDDHGSYFGSDDESNIKDISSEKLTSQEQYDSNSKTCSSVLETKAIKMNNVTENCPESIKLPSPDYLEDHLGSTHGIASDSSQLSTFNRPSSLSSEIGRPLKRSRWCNMCKIRHLVCPQFCQQNRTTRNPKPAEGTLNTVKEKNLMCETCVLVGSVSKTCAEAHFIYQSPRIDKVIHIGLYAAARPHRVAL